MEQPVPDVITAVIILNRDAGLAPLVNGLLYRLTDRG